MIIYLIHAQAERVFACEWNPEAVKALKLNLAKNKIEDTKCIVLEGDNRKTCPTDIADHVNLGLLPSRYVEYGNTGCGDFKLRKLERCTQRKFLIFASYCTEAPH